MEKNIPLGFIYYLQNPITAEIFYIGATQVSLKNRLRSHYQHLREFERGKRKRNKRYDYLVNLRPEKATVHLLEIVTDGNLDDIESKYIKKFRELNPKLTNMTDGGSGGNTYKYQSKKGKKSISKKISQKNKGKKKPKGFAENLSKNRIGIKNPAAKELNDWIVSDNKYLCKYGFEVNIIANSKDAYGNIHRSLKSKKESFSCGKKWCRFSNISKDLQDIVRLNYESNF